MIPEKRADLFPGVTVIVGVFQQKKIGMAEIPFLLYMILGVMKSENLILVYHTAVC